jgi:tyrosyl-tRNA synthetase
MQLSADELEKPLTSLLVDAGMAKSGKQVKDALGRSAVLINGEPVSMAQNAATAACFAQEKAMYGRYFVVKLGKKTYQLFCL